MRQNAKKIGKSAQIRYDTPMNDILSKQDFAELSARVQVSVKGLSWWQLHGMETATIFGRLAIFFAGLWVCSLGMWFTWPLGLLMMAFAYTGIAITGTHETSHLAYTKKTWTNKIWAYLFSDFWSAQSHLWWHYRHVQVHHVYPNIPEREPKPFYFPWMNRYVYFFVTPYFIILWLIVNSVKHLRTQPLQLLAYLVVMLSGFAFHAWLFSLLGFSALPSLGLAVLMRVLLAPIFMHIAVFNHIGLDNPEQVLPWIPRQDKTTRNVKPNWFLKGMGGNAFLECHIEHHLFPGLSNHMLTRISPMVREFLQTKGYQYRSESYLSCLRNCLKHYHELFQNLPNAIW